MPVPALSPTRTRPGIDTDTRACTGTETETGAGEELERERARDERPRARLQRPERPRARVRLLVRVRLRGRAPLRAPCARGGGEEAREEAVDVVCGAGVDRDGGIGGAAGAREAEEGGGREAGEDGFGDELDVEEALGEELWGTIAGVSLVCFERMEDGNKRGEKAEL